MTKETQLIIWKYPLFPTINKLPFPVGARVLTVQEQDGNLCLWVQVDVNAEREERIFTVYGTGWVMPKNPGTYVGTAQLQSLVFHVYEEVAHAIPRK